MCVRDVDSLVREELGSHHIPVWLVSHLPLRSTETIKEGGMASSTIMECLLFVERLR